MLSPAREDYIEAIWSLGQQRGEVRVTDIARRLGVRLPTVTRTVASLARMRLLEHRHRGTVRLSPSGQNMAQCLFHRHEDLVTLLRDILCLPARKAARDACKLEHGLSPIAAQRLHEFLLLLDGHARLKKDLLGRMKARSARRSRAFTSLGITRSDGWRF